MSGHSKWSTIKRKKGKADAERSRVFTRLIKEITVAARQGGADEENNPRLRSAIQTAKAANMPQVNIERAVQRGTGELPGVHYEEVLYEGYGPGGVAVLVEGLTDNKNRTVSEIRHAFDKNGGHMAGSGPVAWMFDLKGFIAVDRGAVEEDDLMLIAMDAGAEDLQAEEDAFEITTEVGDFETVKEALDKHGFPPSQAELIRIPQNTVRIEGKIAEQVLRLMESLEDQDDVQKVYANFDLDDETMKALTAE